MPWYTPASSLLMPFGRRPETHYSASSKVGFFYPTYGPRPVDLSPRRSSLPQHMPGAPPPYYHYFPHQPPPGLMPISDRPRHHSPPSTPPSPDSMQNMPPPTPHMLRRRNSSLESFSDASSRSHGSPKRKLSRRHTLSANSSGTFDDSNSSVQSPIITIFPGPGARAVRFNENPVCASPIPKRVGWFNRKGDQLWTNEGGYVEARPGEEYPRDLDCYPEPGRGWMNEEGVRIDMRHRVLPKAPLRSALKRRTV